MRDPGRVQLRHRNVSLDRSAMSKGGGGYLQVYAPVIILQQVSTQGLERNVGAS